MEYSENLLLLYTDLINYSGCKSFVHPEMGPGLTPGGILHFFLHSSCGPNLSGRSSLYLGKDFLLYFYRVSEAHISDILMFSFSNNKYVLFLHWLVA